MGEGGFGYRVEGRENREKKNRQNVPKRVYIVIWRSLKDPPKKKEERKIR